MDTWLDSRPEHTRTRSLTRTHVTPTHNATRTDNPASQSRQAAKAGTRATSIALVRDNDTITGALGVQPTLIGFGPPERSGSWIKRCVDVVGAAVALLVTSPLILLIAVAIKLESRGPVFFAHRRLGRKGHLFSSYLKVADQCDVCGEELFHHRADDMPPYIAIVIVGHIIVGLMLELELHATVAPWMYMVTMVPLAVILPLLMLPSIKGAIVGLQWANRMYGFDERSKRPNPALPSYP